MDVNDTQYRASVTLWKAVWAFIYAWFGIGASVITLDVPESLESFLATWQVWVFPTAYAMVKAAINWAKQNGYVSNPLKVSPAGAKAKAQRSIQAYKSWILLLGLSLAFTGCAFAGDGLSNGWSLPMVTITHPDGTVEQRIDIVAVETMANNAIDNLLLLAERIEQLSESRDSREREQAQRRQQEEFERLNRYIGALEQSGVDVRGILERFSGSAVDGK